MGIARSRRILVVDNDPYFLHSVQVLLNAKGYTVFATSNPEKAKQIALKERVHVAVLDIRMNNDSDRDDMTGLILAGQLDPLIVKIMLTAYPSVEVVRSTYGEVAAFAFVTKDELPQGLFDALSRAFADEIGINFDLSIHWQGISLEDVAREVEMDGRLSLTVVKEEVEEVLCKLFHQANEILVTPLIPFGQARSVSQSGAVLLKVQPSYKGSQRGAPFVVKLAAREKIVIEADNYEQYVRGYIAGFRHTTLHDKVETHLLGGIAYTLVGTTPLEECVDLGTFYAAHSASEVFEVLKGLFLETCSHWYENRKERRTHELMELYGRPLKLSVERLESAMRQADLSEWIRGGTRLRVRGLRGTFINPIEWYRRHPSLQGQISLCRTHGDLHSQNVLLDGNHQAWLIDFYRTGRGHIFRDLIELECDVKFVLLNVVDLSSLVHLETVLLSARYFDDTPTLPSFRQPELKKAFSVVQGIRQIAGGLAGESLDMLDYYQGLLLQTLAMIRLRHVVPEKKCHAYLAASLLCQRLDEW